MHLGTAASANLRELLPIDSCQDARPAGLRVGWAGAPDGKGAGGGGGSSTWCLLRFRVFCSVVVLAGGVQDSNVLGH